MVSESARVAEALHGSDARQIGKTTNSDMQICACPDAASLRPPRFCSLPQSLNSKTRIYEAPQDAAPAVPAGGPGAGEPGFDF
jgi:hypothetical protein